MEMQRESKWLRSNVSSKGTFLKMLSKKIYECGVWKHEMLLNSLTWWDVLALRQSEPSLTSCLLSAVGLTGSGSLLRMNSSGARRQNPSGARIQIWTPQDIKVKANVFDENFLLNLERKLYIYIFFLRTPLSPLQPPKVFNLHSKPHQSNIRKAPRVTAVTRV